MIPDHSDPLDHVCSLAWDQTNKARTKRLTSAPGGLSGLRDVMTTVAIMVANNGSVAWLRGGSKIVYGSLIFSAGVSTKTAARLALTSSVM
jgi:hypothetical protein